MRVLAAPGGHDYFQSSRIATREGFDKGSELSHRLP